MIETTSIMFDVGVIASVGFIGAAIASRVRIPIIIGYIIAGIRSDRTSIFASSARRTMES